jgi:3-phenylpropionate/trans-cinnamate dioxygenase ferredoxin reductase component
VRVVIAGAGLAAQRCSEVLRVSGHDGPIVIVGAEPHAPYDRPPLSKAFLVGEEVDPRLRPARWYADHDVELRLGMSARRLDARRRELVLAGGAAIRYDRLLIATGAAPVLPAMFAAAGAQSLRTLEDAGRLRDRLAPGVRLAVIGAGLVGQEVASAAVARGARVTLIDGAPAPFDALVGPALGGWLAAEHREAGVHLRLGAMVAGVERARLRLDDGKSVPFDHLLVAIGVRPATGWLEGSGLDPHGVAVDGRGQTALPDVYAAGDAACTFDRVVRRHVSAGHWEAAARQGAAAARAMLGLSPVRPAPTVVWSDQHGMRLQRLGDPRGADGATLDGDPRERSFVVTYQRTGRPVAAVAVGRPGALSSLRRRLEAAARHERMAA